MHRKQFLSVIPGVLGIPSMQSTLAVGSRDSLLVPPFLQRGDTIGICSPAGYVSFNEIQPAIQQFEAWGLRVLVGDSIGKRDGTFGGSDQERASDLQALIRRTDITAIMCARGGYGVVRIIDEIDFSPLLHHPKWIIGFSDITVLHSHFSNQVPIASIHAKMCTSFPEQPALADAEQVATIESIRQVLFGEPIAYPVTPHPSNRLGSASGLLVGGNLKTIETLSGTKSALHTAKRILFLEDTGEYLYSIDRMFWHLKRSGLLDNLAGLIIGGFKLKQAETLSEEFGKNVVEIVLEKVQNTTYPICFQFPVGHQRNNYALACGVNHELQVFADRVTLQKKDQST
jgi:muramoyltetrapeptide carboxypeptidase